MPELSKPSPRVDGTRLLDSATGVGPVDRVTPELPEAALIRAANAGATELAPGRDCDRPPVGTLEWSTTRGQAIQRRRRLVVIPFSRSVSGLVGDFQSCTGIAQSDLRRMNVAHLPQQHEPEAGGAA